jgi:beta-glucosidase
MSKPVKSYTKSNYRFPRFNAAKSVVPVRRFALPRDFVFGASTSAYQIEGIAGDTGRGRSIWEDYFAARPHLDNGEVACDHYNRMKEDVAMIKRMGLKAYRFSVSWPRIIPGGVGAINQKGLDFYSALVDELLANGIEPYLTLYHWDLPSAMEAKGGWRSREVAEHFADYAAVVVRHLGDRVKKWCTFNEPEVIVAGYIGTGLAPGLDDYSQRVRVGHNLMVAHGLAMKRLRAYERSLDCGIVLNLVPAEAADRSPEAAAAARKHWQRNYSWYVDGILNGRYPDVVLDEAQATGVAICAEDMALINQPIDYLGVNWYLRHVVDGKGQVVSVPGATETLMGWEIHAPALTRMLVAMNKEYKLPPIYITENGAAIADTLEAGGVHDVIRTQYIYDHIGALEAASLHGVNLRGYFAWSLMDNLEWSLGYKMTFGIVHVDRQTLKRTIKDSGLWYGATIRANTRKNRKPRSRLPNQGREL